jgi:hypothetical protein
LAEITMLLARADNQHYPVITLQVFFDVKPV